MLKDWEKTGNWGKRHQNVYGLKGKKKVIWLDNWRQGDWGVIIGEEHSRKGTDLPSFVEKEILFNGTKKDALYEQKDYMRSH